MVGSSIRLTHLCLAILQRFSLVVSPCLFRHLYFNTYSCLPLYFYRYVPSRFGRGNDLAVDVGYRKICLGWFNDIVLGEQEHIT